MSEIDEAADPAAVIEAYYDAGWTDGLPVVPPSDTSIAATLAAAGLEGPELLGEIPGRNTEVIAENATIGRAVRLIMMNAMNTRPGFLDRATLGNPGKYAFCFAEHEEDHPWEPLHVSRGLRREDSAVTLIASNSLYQVYNHLAAEPEPLLYCFADALGNVGTSNLLGFNETLIVFAGEHAEVLQKAGWSRLDVQRFLIERTRRSVADYKRGARLPGPVTPADETTWRYRFERPEDILIAFAGGRAGSWSACLPGWGTKWTRSVTTRIELSEG